MPTITVAFDEAYLDNYGSDNTSVPVADVTDGSDLTYASVYETYYSGDPVRNGAWLGLGIPAIPGLSTVTSIELTARISATNGTPSSGTLLRMSAEIQNNFADSVAFADYMDCAVADTPETFTVPMTEETLFVAPEDYLSPTLQRGDGVLYFHRAALGSAPEEYYGKVYEVTLTITYVPLSTRNNADTHSKVAKFDIGAATGAVPALLPVGPAEEGTYRIPVVGTISARAKVGAETDEFWVWPEARFQVWDGTTMTPTLVERLGNPVKVGPAPVWATHEIQIEAPAEATHWRYALACYATDPRVGEVAPAADVTLYFDSAYIPDSGAALTGQPFLDGAMDGAYWEGPANHATSVYGTPPEEPVWESTDPPPAPGGGSTVSIPVGVVTRQSPSPVTAIGSPWGDASDSTFVSFGFPTDATHLSGCSAALPATVLDGTLVGMDVTIRAKTDVVGRTGTFRVVLYPVDPDTYPGDYSSWRLTTDPEFVIEDIPGAWTEISSTENGVLEYLMPGSSMEEFRLAVEAGTAHLWINLIGDGTGYFSVSEMTVNFRLE